MIDVECSQTRRETSAVLPRLLSLSMMLHSNACGIAVWNCLTTTCMPRRLASPAAERCADARSLESNWLTGAGANDRRRPATLHFREFLRSRGFAFQTAREGRCVRYRSNSTELSNSRTTRSSATAEKARVGGHYAVQGHSTSLRCQSKTRM